MTNKVKINLTIDPFLWQDAKLNHINASKVLEDSLTMQLAVLNKDLDGVNLKRVKREMEVEEKELYKKQKKVNELRQMIEVIEKKKLEQEKKVMAEQEEKIIKSKSCMKCGNIIEKDGKTFDVEGKKVCKSCYMSTPPVDMMKWVKESVTGQ